MILLSQMTSRLLLPDGNSKGESGVGQKILIVDDEAFIRTLLQRTLSDLEDEEDVELLFAADGEAALQMIQDERPDLVFLDVMMPKMNGFDVCNAVKNDLQLDDVTIILLTAKGQIYDKVRGADVGADKYITKPFDPDEILEMASGILGL